MTKAIVRTQEQQAIDDDAEVLAILYIEDPFFDPDQEYETQGEKGLRPLRIVRDPTYLRMGKDLTRKGEFKLRSDAGQWMPRFLKAYRETGSLGKACTVAHVSRETVHRWRSASPDFDRMVLDALDNKLDDMEERSIERALGNSSLDTFFMLKRYRPEFRDNWGQSVNVRYSGEVQVNQTVRVLMPHNGRDEVDPSMMVEGEYQEIKGLGDGEDRSEADQDS